MHKPLTTPSAHDVEAIRQQFPILSRTVNGKPLIYLDSAASSQKPDAVIDALTHYYRHTHANVHRGAHRLSQEATDAYEQARTTLARFLNAEHPEEIVFTRGTTDSINLVAATFAEAHLQAGDSILITGMEHHSNIVPWQMVCEKRGATLKVVPVTDSGELRIDQLEKLLTSEVRLLALTHLSNTLGTINPIKDIVRLAHSRDIPVLVDGAQAVPHLPVDVRELDVDFYCFSGHKMYGPTGIGVLYGKSRWLEELPPWQGGGEMIERVTFEKTTYNTPPFRFEAGTPAIAQAHGLARAALFMEEIGRERIAEHGFSILQYAQQQLKTIDGLRFVGQAERQLGSLSFILEGTHPYDVGTLLDQMGIAVRTGHHCTQPLMDQYGLPGTVRASFGVYNTKADVGALAKGLQRAAKMLR